MTPLRDFYDRLEAHDWYYAMSDDHRWYERGLGEEHALRAIAAESPAHDELYEAFRKHYYGLSDNEADRPAKPIHPDSAEVEREARARARAALEMDDLFDGRKPK